MAYKLQHWMLKIQYIPGWSNTLADALSREEKTRHFQKTPETSPDVNLVLGSVEDPLPYEEGWQQPSEVRVEQ